MFKLPGNIILIFILLLSTSGITISKHYCGKTLVHTAIYSTPDKCCTGNCTGCHDKRVHIQIKDRFESSTSQFDLTAQFKTINEQYFLTLFTFDGINSLAALTSNQRAKRNPYIKFSDIQIASNQISFLQTFLI